MSNKPNSMYPSSAPDKTSTPPPIRGTVATQNWRFSNSYRSLQRFKEDVRLANEEENKYDKKIGEIFHKIDDATASFRLLFYHKVNHPLKRLLFRLPKPGKKDKFHGRMRPKPATAFVGFMMAVISALCLSYIFAVTVPSGAAVASYVPWLSFSAAVPFPVWILTAVLGTWLMSSRPFQNRQHGVLHAMVARPEREFNSDRITQKYDNLAQCASKMFNVRDSYISKGMWTYGIFDGIDEIVETMSFHLIPIKDFSVAQEGTPCAHFKGSRSSEKEVYARYDEAIEQFDAVMDIWTSHVGLAISSAKFSMTSFRDYDRGQKLKEIVDLGRKLGVEEAVDAYMAGVPLDDVLA